MRRETTSRETISLKTTSRVLCAVGLLGALAVPSVAMADDDVTVALHEDESGVTLQIRGVSEPTHEQVVTSKTGALLFVRGADATAQRLHPMGKHRLRFVQVGRAGERVAVRVVQRKAARGSLSKHLEMQPVAGGFDVRIDDGITPPIAAPVVAAAAEPAAQAPGFDRASALAKLSGGAPAAAAAKPAPVVVQPLPPAPPLAKVAKPELAAPIAETPAVVTAEIAAPVAANELGGTAIEDAKAAPDDAGARWAGTANQDAAPIDLKTNAPRIGMAWLATAMLAFSGLGLVWWRRRRPVLSTPDALRVVAKVSIGPKQQIIWLSAGGRTLLVGATEHRIELLAELDQPQQAGASTPVAATPGAMPLGNIGITQAVAAAAAPGNNGQRVAAFKQRLRAALGDELAGRGNDTEPALPPHLEMLTGEPRWARKDAA